MPMKMILSLPMMFFMIWTTKVIAVVPDLTPVSNMSESNLIPQKNENHTVASGSLMNLRGKQLESKKTTNTKDHHHLPIDVDYHTLLCQRGNAMATYINSITKSGETFQYPCLFQSTKAEEKAIAWLADLDPLQLNPQKAIHQDRVRQRYALMMFNVQQTNTTRWRFFDKWGTKAHECTWFGVHCNAFNQVVEFDLTNNNIVGNIPPDLALMTPLKTLALGHNKLSGLIPSAIQYLNQMEYFDLSYNQLDGTIPNVFATWISLRFFSLANNTIMGALPSTIFQLRNIQSFLVQENQLSGSIPVTIVDWKDQIQTLRLEKNDFGEYGLPAEIPISFCPVDQRDLFLTVDCDVVCSCFTSCTVH
jgi:Leucine rich repeat